MPASPLVPRVLAQPDKIVPKQAYCCSYTAIERDCRSRREQMKMSAADFARRAGSSKMSQRSLSESHLRSTTGFRAEARAALASAVSAAPSVFQQTGMSQLTSPDSNFSAASEAAGSEATTSATVLPAATAAELELPPIPAWDYDGGAWRRDAMRVLAGLDLEKSGLGEVCTRGRKLNELFLKRLHLEKLRDVEWQRKNFILELKENEPLKPATPS
eukprot:TRINITY_DN75806_c0_g1_i1.p1 TRINITY_DN75806_c0_g1~~TRINITY_DN75806_c0_g1_i1.p1  ORF type:complete len:250 (-),score=53.13 TRINITY_DN75806_c0_g1_i1:98-745(-)